MLGLQKANNSVRYAPLPAENIWERVLQSFGVLKDGSLAQLVEQLAFNQLVVGSNPTRPTTLFGVVGVLDVLFAVFRGSLAQLVEQLAFNQLVVGSNPTRPTIS